MALIKTINFKSLGDERGSLVSLEVNKSIPFSVRRVYYIFNPEEGVSRGFHAHRKLKQVAICIQGSCRFIIDNGKKREEIVLEGAEKGLLIEDLTWREMHDFSSDCILIILADEWYDESDYIRDYEEFLKEVKCV